MSSYSVKMRTRVSFHRPACLDRHRPERRQLGAHVLPDPVDQLADPGVGQARGRLGDLGHLVERAAARGRTARGVRAGSRRRRGRLDLGVFLGLRAPPRQSVARSSSLPTPSATSRSRSRCARPSRPSRLAAPAAAATVRRWTRSVRANASTEESRRCCSPEISRPAAACLRLRLALEPLLAELGGTRRAARERRSSGASAGRPSRSICLTIRCGKPPCDLAEVLLEPADHDVVEQLLALDRHAAAEPLRVEDLQQGGEAVGVAVVRRGRQEQPVLEPRRPGRGRPG